MPSASPNPNLKRNTRPSMKKAMSTNPNATMITAITATTDQSGIITSVVKIITTTTELPRRRRERRNVILDE